MYVESHIDNTNTTSKNPNIGSALTLSTCISIGTRVHAGELEKPSQLSSAFPKSIVDIFGPGSVVHALQGGTKPLVSRLHEL